MNSFKGTDKGLMWCDVKFILKNINAVPFTKKETFTKLVKIIVLTTLYVSLLLKNSDLLDEHRRERCPWYVENPYVFEYRHK